MQLNRMALASALVLISSVAQAELSLNLIPTGFHTKSVIFEGFVLNTVRYEPDNLKLVLQSDLGNLDCGPEDVAPPGQVYIELDGRVYNIDNTSQTPILLDPDAVGGPSLTIEVEQQNFSCAPSLNTSLALSVDGQEELPIGAAVTHTVDLLPENNLLAITVNDPLLCGQVGPGTGQMGVEITDPNGDSAVFRGLVSVSFDTNNLDFAMTTNSDLQCFAFPGGGIPRAVQGGGSGEILFADDFELREVELQIDVTTQGSAIVGQTFNYQIIATNLGPRNADRVVLNEFFPTNSSNFPATLGAGSWTCSASPGASCGSGAAGSGAVNIGQVSLPVGASITMNVSRTVFGSADAALQIFAAVYPESADYDANLGNNVSALNTQTTNNDPPDVDLNGAAPGIDYSPLFVPGAPVSLADPLRGLVTDSNDGTLEKLTLRLLSAPDGGLERLQYDCSLRGGITCTWFPGTLEFVVEGTDSIANYQTALRSVAYNNFATSPTASDRIVQITVDDGSAVSPLAVSTVRIQENNTGPVVDLNGADTGINNAVNWQQGGQPALLADADATVSDDSSMLVEATVVITDIADIGDEVLIVDTTGSNIGSAFNSTTGTLSLFGSDTVANYEAVVKTLRYENLNLAPSGSTRSIEVTVSDGVLISQVAVTTVTYAVNQRPVVDLSGPDVGGIDYTVNYTPGGPAVPIGDNLNLTVSDDEGTISQAQVQIMNPLNTPNKEILSAAGLCLNLGTSFNSSTHTLSITGVAPANDYAVCLRGVTYRNTATVPDTADRIIEVRVFDGSLWNDPVAESTVVYQ